MAKVNGTIRHARLRNAHDRGRRLVRVIDYIDDVREKFVVVVDDGNASTTEYDRRLSETIKNRNKSFASNNSTGINNRK